MASTALMHARAAASEAVKAGRARIAKVHREARTDAKKARIMQAIEAPVGGALAGALDARVSWRLAGLVPPSVPAGAALAIGGSLANQGDLMAIGSGMIAGAAYQLTAQLLS